MCFDKEQELHGSWCRTCWGKGDKVIRPLLMEHKYRLRGQGVDLLELGFSLSQGLRIKTES